MTNGAYRSDSAKRTARQFRSALQTLRARPPDTVRTNHDYRVFSASLIQFDELLEASSAVGPTSRPLTLYYALNQAGRALVAAAGLPTSWGAHGLHATNIDRLNGNPGQLIVQEEGDGAFQRVSAALGSNGLHHPTCMGALWASLPELSKTCPDEPTWLRPLLVVHQPQWGFKTTAETFSVLSPPSTRLPYMAVCGTVCFERPVFASELPEILRDYSSTNGWTLRTPMGAEAQKCVELSWPAKAHSESDWFQRIDEIAEPYYLEDGRWARATLEGAQLPPHPLMTWWILLYGLSMLCRYHPAAWSEILAPHSSRFAVATERLLDVALERLPHLVHEGITGERALVKRELDVIPLP
jgi:hypothetical protein